MYPTSPLGPLSRKQTFLGSCIARYDNHVRILWNPFSTHSETLGSNPNWTFYLWYLGVKEIRWNNTFPCTNRHWTKGCKISVSPKLWEGQVPHLQFALLAEGKLLFYSHIPNWYLVKLYNVPACNVIVAGFFPSHVQQITEHSLSPCLRAKHNPKYTSWNNRAECLKGNSQNSRCTGWLWIKNAGEING